MSKCKNDTVQYIQGANGHKKVVRKCGEVSHMGTPLICLECRENKYARKYSIVNG